jgi:hypothetical protein
MRRALIDECLPVQLYRALAGFDARTVSFMMEQLKRRRDFAGRKRAVRHPVDR